MVDLWGANSLGLCNPPLSLKMSRLSFLWIVALAQRVLFFAVLLGRCAVLPFPSFISLHKLFHVLKLTLLTLIMFCKNARIISSCVSLAPVLQILINEMRWNVDTWLVGVVENDIALHPHDLSRVSSLGHAAVNKVSRVISVEALVPPSPFCLLTYRAESTSSVVREVLGIVRLIPSQVSEG